MRKLYLLLDEWNNDKNFVGKELDVICRFFDVTIVCNSAEGETNPSVRYVVYKRPSKSHAIKSLIKMIFDSDIYKELGRVLKEGPDAPGKSKLAKVSEAVRFYLNSCLFYDFMKRENLIEDNAIYYTYWFFWKCYAMTHNKKNYPNSKIITRTHEYDLYDYTIASGYQPFKVSMDEVLDKIIFIADHGRDYYLNKYGKELSDKYLLCYLGTNDPKALNPYQKETEETDRAEADKAEAYRAEADIRDKEITIVSCSSIIPRKRVSYIAEALSLIDGVNVNWIHYGAGELMDELKALTKEKLDKKANIKYTLAGYTKNEEIMNYYCNNPVTAFITTSSSEGNPVSVMEAMSYGIPVIAPAVCNIPKLIEGCGILISENPSYEEIKDAILSLSEMSENDMAKLRESAFASWGSKFRGSVNNEKFVTEVLCKLNETE